ncbi:MAG: hypothetical protein NTY48_04150 [Candidatus Diapherotrites archaeon]|nr:hypothetical protein [Candidatus Diapherotrites archaeon]
MGTAQKVLLVGPFKNSELRAGQFFSPPNGVYRIKSFVEKKTDASVDVVDVDLDGFPFLGRKIIDNNYDIIGFSLLYPTIKNDIELMHTARLLSPKSILIAGGQGAVFIKKELLSKTPLDIVVHGFGEFPIAEMINSIKKGSNKPEDFREIKGLSIKTSKGIIDTGYRDVYSNKDYAKIANSFDYSVVPYEKYWEHMELKYSKQVLEVMKNDGLLYTIRLMTSSHCPMRCTFCSATNFLEDATGKLQCSLETDVGDIIKSMKQAIKFHPNVNAFYFNDDNLLQNSERAAELCKALVNEFGTKSLNYFCLSRTDNVEPNILSLMRIAGFKLIIYGVESFSNKILKDIQKKIASNNPSRLAEKVIMQTINSGITPLMNILLFYPTTTINDIVETIEKSIPLIEKGARITVFSFVEFYPGSDISNEKNIEYQYEKFRINNQSYCFPWAIMPKNKEVKEFALSAIGLREKLIKEIKTKYNYQRELPHPVFSLSLFLAVFKLLEKSTIQLDNLIDSLMIEAKNEEAKVVVYGRN